MKKESEADQSGRKVGKDLVRFANDGDRNEDEKTNYLMEPIQTFDRLLEIDSKYPTSSLVLVATWWPGSGRRAWRLTSSASCGR